MIFLIFEVFTEYPYLKIQKKATNSQLKLPYIFLFSGYH